jgi:hypothetical protein
MYSEKKPGFFQKERALVRFGYAREDFVYGNTAFAGKPAPTIIFKQIYPDARESPGQV